MTQQSDTKITCDSGQQSFTDSESLDSLQKMIREGEPKTETFESIRLTRIIKSV